MVLENKEQQSILFYFLKVLTSHLVSCILCMSVCLCELQVILSAILGSRTLSCLIVDLLFEES